MFGFLQFCSDCKNNNKKDNARSFFLGTRWPSDLFASRKWLDS